MKPGGRPRDEGERVRRAELTAAPAGAGWHAVSARGSSKTALWPSFAVDFLLSCGQFKPLAGHVEAYARYHGLEASQLREITHWAEQMTGAGLLQSTREVVQRCVAAGSGAGEPARIEEIGIPTGGGEERLRRVVSSFARNAREHGRSPRITVASNGPADTAALLAGLARSECVPITVLDEAERLAWGADLARRAGVDPAIAEFALSDPLGAGFACGANRNALLLRHAGRPFLSLDDDVVCEMALAPGKGSAGGLAVFASRDGFERWFYPEYARAFESRRPVECDYLGLHEKMLGKTAGALLGCEPEPDFVSVTDELLRRLQESDGRIVTTFTGHYGHPGIPTSYYYLTYRRRTLARLTGEGETAYRSFLGSGGVCALAPRMAVADASLSPGMAMGIDARLLMPPFPPVMHAEDFVWGAVVWQCCPNGLAGHLPVALRHDPGVGRGILAPPLSGQAPVAVWEFAHLLRGLIAAWAPPPGMVGGAIRMESLGRHLCEIASQDGADFREYLRWFVLHHESEKIAFMEECVAEETEAPDYWRSDVADYIEQTRLALAEGDYDIPYDMRQKWPAADARVLMQQLVLEYGRLLQVWPGLVDAARAD